MDLGNTDKSRYWCPLLVSSICKRTMDSKRKSSAFWKYCVDGSENEDVLNGSIVGGMEPIFMPLKVLKSVCFECCELR